MAKSTRSPLEKFLAKSRDMARDRETKNGWAHDDTLSVEYLVGVYHGQKGMCYHTGKPMNLVRGLVDGAVDFNLCTIDRIDNSIGYVRGNILMARDGINRMRRDMPLQEFREVCRQIGAAA